MAQGRRVSLTVKQVDMRLTFECLVNEAGVLRNVSCKSLGLGREH